jgi:hypothetical protein
VSAAEVQRSRDDPPVFLSKPPSWLSAKYRIGNAVRCSAR